MTMKHYFTHFFAAMVIMATVSPDAQAAKTEIKVPAEVDSEQEAIRHDDIASMVIVDGDCNSIRVYNLSGLLVGNADTSALEQGFYIAVADMADGTRLTLQFAKK